MMKFSARSPLSCFSILLVIMLWCWSANVHAVDPLSVFVSILPQKYFVERIGGNRLQVSVMVGQGRSPATYEPTPRQMVKLAQARLYFRIGVPFEDIWLERIAAANPNMEVVDCRQDILLLPTADAHGPRRGKEGHRATDPHIWTSPPLVKSMATCIRNALVAVAPAYSNQFEENYQAFIQELDQLDQFIRQTLAGVTHHRFMVFHPAWRYFAHTYGLEEIAIEQAGKEPSAKSLARLIGEAREEGTQAIFVQKQFSRANANTVARAIGAKVVTVDPLAEDYVNNLRHVTTLLAEALR